MKKLFLVIFVCSIYSCQEEEDDLVNPEPVKTAQVATTSVADQACIMCEIDLKVIELQNKVSALYRNKNRQEEMLKNKAELDSLNKVYSDMLVKFNNDVVRVQHECAKNYHIDFVTDTAKRNELFASYYVWYHNATYPSFDTVGYEPVIKNGMYEVQHRGETHLWNKAQHANYLKVGLETKAKTDAMYNEALKKIATEITGLPIEKIDPVCIFVLGSVSLGYQAHSYVKKYKETNKEYNDYTKIQVDYWGQ